MLLQEIEKAIRDGVLNFAVVGCNRSGTGVIQAMLQTFPGVVCHQNLFHPDTKIRKKCYMSYFSDKNYFKYNETNPTQFLSHQIFDHRKYNEKCVGVRITYDVMLHLDLFDYFNYRYLEGDFCLIHVIRNPIACYVSELQAQATGRYCLLTTENYHNKKPTPVLVDIDHLVSYIKKYESAIGKVDNCCHDRINIKYYDILFNFQNVVRRIVHFLELPDILTPVRCPFQRLPNWPMRYRIANYGFVEKYIPSGFKHYLTDPEFV